MTDPTPHRRIVHVDLPEDLAEWLVRHLEQSTEPKARRISTRTATRLREVRHPRQKLDGCAKSTDARVVAGLSTLA